MYCPGHLVLHAGVLDAEPPLHWQGYDRVQAAGEGDAGGWQEGGEEVGEYPDTVILAQHRQGEHQETLGL